MVNRRGGRNSAPSGPSALMQLQQRLNSQKVSMNGAKMVPSQVPRAFVQYPWNSWTFEDTLNVTSASTQTLEITFQKIADQFSQKLGISGSLSLRVKIQSAQVWCTANGLAYPQLRADFYEINGNAVNAASVRSSQADKGTLNMPARAGYIYPASDSKDVLNSGESALKVVAAQTALTSGATLTIRVQVLWQIRPASSYISSDTDSGYAEPEN